MGGHLLVEGRIVMNRVSRLGLLGVVVGLVASGPGCRMMDSYYEDDDHERCSEYQRLEPQPERQRGVTAAREPGIYPGDDKR